MTYENAPQTEQALDVLHSFMVAATCAKYGIPNDPGPLLDHTHADAEILPGDLHRLTGFGREENGS